ncbi:MAG: hypothetical protein K0R18_1899 [Bacillales bacterium]|jgi:aminoglycoside 6-adenylyltransferase|nr:hypothetical protein [Bacillales bacterium]
MLNETEVFGLLNDLFNADLNIQVAVLNGSRANPNAPKDFLQDYDVRVYVKDLTMAINQYRVDQRWINQFGELVIMQINDFNDGAFIIMSQFKSALRIDLSFQHLSKLQSEISKDSLNKILIDKGGNSQPNRTANETSYFVKKPTQQEWNRTLNELWWLQPYIAKELWRDEIPLVKKLYDNILMVELRNLLEWQVGEEYNWEVNVGHAGKWLKQLLPEVIYAEFIHFYSSADSNEQWDKLLRMGSFIRKIAQPLALKLGYEYPIVNDERVSEYIREINLLPIGTDTLLDVQIN